MESCSSGLNIKCSQSPSHEFANLFWNLTIWVSSALKGILRHCPSKTKSTSIIFALTATILCIDTPYNLEIEVKVSPLSEQTKFSSSKHKM